MARNAEKAKSMLARFHMGQMVEAGKSAEYHRPNTTSTCKHPNHAKQYRREIIQEISEKMIKIQDEKLEEHQIRDLNDQINKLFREKGAWEFRILELGGKFKAYHPDSVESRALPGDRTYRYFGRAKDLPGVKELFANQEIPEDRKSRFEMIKLIDPDYFGFRDEEIEGLLLEEEEFERSHNLNASLMNLNLSQIALTHQAPIPSQKEVEQALLERKKAELIRKYAGEI